MNKKVLFLGALTVATLTGAVGSSLLTAQKTNAQTDTVDQMVAAAPSADPTKATHVGANGVYEQLLTGDVADKVKAAALAAQPGATIQRVETDAEGSPYEAHMVKADGTRVTVKVDESFKVTSTENGMH